ncbi:MAG TPA: SMP-30/gluconolactonase/LRE family protein [Tepidisphaeraceae bacterium]|jgi:enterochelin esterase family protein|nr:SMP-30/gluconolactonase/LRE family protein [Tepidisphaeraceae bacterium]
MKRILWAMSVLALIWANGVFAAESTSLSAVVPDGQWEIAVEGLGFSDGLTLDGEGNLYFSDLRAKPAVVWKLGVDGTKTKVAEGQSRSGLRMGADGKLYACGSGKIAVYELPGGKETILGEGLQPNDLTVSARGFVYFTETGKKQITMLDSKSKQVKAVDVGINKPNGIALSPDQSVLYVSDYGGLNVWAFKVGEDGMLSEKKALMTMKAPEKTPTSASGDGMTTDTEGRAYVTTALGVQVFDKEGKLLGTLAKPMPNAPLVSVGFAGKDLDVLYIACGDKIYKRKTNAKGAAGIKAQ